MKKKVLPAYAGRKPCGCVVEVVVAEEPLDPAQLDRPGVKFEEVPVWVVNERL